MRVINWQDLQDSDADSETLTREAGHPVYDRLLVREAVQQRLGPFFARLSSTRPWISLDEIFEGLPDFSHRRRETALALIRATLKESPYRSLGGDRWTTPRLFNQINREVPCGLSTSHRRANVPIWTEQDKQDFAGYRRQSMPPEARRAVEELEAGERLPEPDDSSWHPPSGSVRLPTLNYLHITQAYFPVRYVIRAFAPDVHMVFVQFIEGDHQPFVVDREHGLLKALHPESLRAKILGDGIPAGTYLWLEYQGGEKYRIAPLPLSSQRIVPCKLAYFENSELHIEHTRIPMVYEGDLSIFKANMRFEEIEVLFAEARRVNLSVRDVIIYAIQQICAVDPRNRAYRSDIFNAVFLKRICSPDSVSLLLYTLSCFEKMGGGYFRYKPTTGALVVDIHKRKNLAARLWDDLISNPVPPDPVRVERKTPVASLEVSYPASPILAPVLQPPFPSGKPEIKLAISIPGSSVVGVETNSEYEMFPRLDVEFGPKGSASFSSLALSESQPASVDIPIQPNDPLPNTAHTRYLTYTSKIPAWPLHKQPIFLRVFFYLRGWLSRKFRRTG